MCGFVGIVGAREAAGAVTLGLQALQHRGQEAAGVATLGADLAPRVLKGLGLAEDVLSPAALATLGGELAVGHVRYPTHGGSGIEHAQPLLAGGVALVHNGNLVNSAELVKRYSLTEIGPWSDSSRLVAAIASTLSDDPTLPELVAGVGQVLDGLRGSYSAALALTVAGRPTLVALRDRYGLRPACFGQRADGAWVIASESAALDALGVRAWEHVPLGSLVALVAGQAPVVVPLQPPSPAPCLFERVYFARADSVLEDGRVHSTREALGRALAAVFRERGHAVDVVMPVPETARPAATAFAAALGLPLREGFVKNRYARRTFILPDAPTRSRALQLKLNALPETFPGQRIALVDDSLVRGSTLARLAAAARSAGAAELHVAIAAPPVLHPCFYGIDMPDPDELIATRFGVDELETKLAEWLGATSVTFLPAPRLPATLGSPRCDACFTGIYPIPICADERHEQQRERPSRQTAGRIHAPGPHPIA